MRRGEEEGGEEVLQGGRHDEKKKSKQYEQELLIEHLLVLFCIKWLMANMFSLAARLQWLGVLPAPLSPPPVPLHPPFHPVLRLITSPESI